VEILNVRALYVFYMDMVLDLTREEEHRFRMCEKKLLRRIYNPKRGEEMRG
jgi:hypothetical protein